MITKYRQRGLLQLAAAVVMTGILFFLFYHARQSASQGHTGAEQGWVGIAIFWYICTIVMWMVATFTLAKAKGYGSDMVGGILVFLYLLGFCFPIAPILFPFVILFGLEDKMKGRTHRSSRVSGHRIRPS